MAEIRKYPDECLATKCEVVKFPDDLLNDVISDMMEHVDQDDVAGIAAPQLGVLKRVIMCKLSSGITLMINPEITFRSSEKAMSNEGCLSVPNLRCSIERNSEIVVKYDDLTCERGKSLQLQDQDAFIVQHELDHLDGTLLFQRMPRASRRSIEAQLKKATRK
jgi:peptide deformylase